MKAPTSFLVALAVLVGLGGATAAYRLAADAGPETAPVSQPVAAADTVDPPTVRGATHFRWAPCPDGSVRRGPACVRELVQTVVVPAPAPVLEVPSGSSGGPGTPGGDPGGDGDDDGYDGDDGGDDRDEDDDRDDDEDDEDEDDEEDEPGED